MGSGRQSVAAILIAVPVGIFLLAFSRFRVGTMAIVRCPICDRPFDPEQSPAIPFCSERCRLVDLRRWLDEEYGLAVEPDEESEDLGSGE